MYNSHTLVPSLALIFICCFTHLFDNLDSLCSWYHLGIGGMVLIYCLYMYYTIRGWDSGFEG